MSSLWESVVIAAREIDDSFASGKVPEGDRAAGLARAVLEFEAHLAGMRREPFKPPSVKQT